MERSFESYTLQHFFPLALVAVLGTLLILYARRHNTKDQYRLLFYLSLVPFFGTLLKYPFLFLDGSFDIREDLPLHMCRAIALAAPWVAIRRKRFWMGVFYFWIIAGTFQANVTPDVAQGFPHWQYFAYWMVHSVLVVVALYYIMVLNVRIGWRDLLNAFLMMNLFVILTLAINYLLGSNYMYTMAKPPVKSMLDVLGPWPVYLVSGQLLALGLFILAILPLKLWALSSGKP